MNPVLGLDYGRARIGVAISDELRLLAHPLETLPANAGAITRLVEIVSSRKIDTIVVGLPRQMSGSYGLAAKEVSDFIDRLRAAVNCPVVAFDERLTTAAAQRALHAAGKNTRQSRVYIDQVAAQIILQGFLDREQAERPIP